MAPHRGAVVGQGKKIEYETGSIAGQKGLLVGLSWGDVAGKGDVSMPIVGGCCNTRMANKINKCASCAAWEFHMLPWRSSFILHFWVQ